MPGVGRAIAGRTAGGWGGIGAGRAGLEVEAGGDGRAGAREGCPDADEDRWRDGYPAGGRRVPLTVE